MVCVCVCVKGSRQAFYLLSKKLAAHSDKNGKAGILLNLSCFERDIWFFPSAGKVNYKLQQKS